MALPAKPRRLTNPGKGTTSVPPHAYFLISAVFHYLGPAFAVLLFAHVSVIGVAWLRIAWAAVILAIWRRPWRLLAAQSWHQRRLLIAFGIVLAAMNTCFYVAIDRLPLGTVGAIEFLGPIALALLGVHRIRNVAALILAVSGVALLADVRLAGEPLGFAFAFANCVLFVFYIVLGHRISQAGGARIDRLAAAMVVAAVVATPVGFAGAMTAFTHLRWLLAGLGVAVCSSVIPYVCDQLAMARLPRATFALLLALLPASAATIGLIVLGQEPHPREITGIGLVIVAVGIHSATP